MIELHFNCYNVQLKANNGKKRSFYHRYNIHTSSVCVFYNVNPLQTRIETLLETTNWGHFGLTYVNFMPKQVTDI